jgi:hypothetical protein
MDLPAGPTLLKHRLKAEEYRARAAEAFAAAESATLERVREQRRAAAATWADLAEAEEARLVTRQTRFSQGAK